MNKKLIFAIDFDGTIVENKYPEIGEINKDVAKFIRALRKKGHIWILWTCRCGKDLEDAVKFLKRHKLKPDYVNESTKENLEAFPDNPKKIFADCYIDDRNAGGLVLPYWLIYR